MRAWLVSAMRPDTVPRPKHSRWLAGCTGSQWVEGAMEGDVLCMRWVGRVFRWRGIAKPRGGWTVVPQSLLGRAEFLG